MHRGRDHSDAAVLHGEAQRVMDRSGRDLVVTREAWEDGQAGGVGGGPAKRPAVVIEKVPDRARLRLPAAIALDEGGEELIEKAVVSIDDENMPVTVDARIRIALDVRRCGDRHRARIALRTVRGVDDVDIRRATHDVVGHAEGIPADKAGAEVRVEMIAGQIGDGLRGEGRDRSIRDVLPPRVACGKGHETIKAGTLAEAQRGAVRSGCFRAHAGVQKRQQEQERSSSHRITLETLDELCAKTSSV